MSLSGQLAYSVLSARYTHLDSYLTHLTGPAGLAGITSCAVVAASQTTPCTPSANPRRHCGVAWCHARLVASRPTASRAESSHRDPEIRRPQPQSVLSKRSHASPSRAGEPYLICSRYCGVSRRGVGGFSLTAVPGRFLREGYSAVWRHSSRPTRGPLRHVAGRWPSTRLSLRRLDNCPLFVIRALLAGTAALGLPSWAISPMPPRRWATMIRRPSFYSPDAPSRASTAILSMSPPPPGWLISTQSRSVF